MFVGGLDSVSEVTMSNSKQEVLMPTRRWRECLITVAVLLFVTTTAVLAAEYIEIHQGEQATESAGSRAQEHTSAREMAGIFFASHDVPVPLQYVTLEDICTRSLELAPTPIDPELPTTPFTLPAEYELVADGMNTGEVECNGVTWSDRWEYRVVGDWPEVGLAIVGRSLLTHDIVRSVEVDLLEIVEIGGQTAVLLMPELRPDSRPMRGAVWFPKPYGYVFIATSRLPLSELMRIARIVAGAAE